MNPKRWKLIKDIVEKAFECPTGNRVSFVAEACGDDLSLRNEVLMLLTDEPETTQTNAGTPLRSLFEKGDGSEYQGMEIGSYVVERELGRGGMGLVLLARDRRDGNPVAIKLLRRSLEGRDAVVRFHYERMILSELSHPNISNVIDGGTTHEGLHFLVMEYVAGEPIDDYCDKRHLSTRERLQLFVKVCEAVSYAHERKIIHRDIKPGNILVTEAGEPVLLDFGIAKATDPDSLAATAPQTATGHRLMTPQYASPEQVKGDVITQACDTYALGVLLYELLTAHLPYTVDVTNTLELSRAICEYEPVSASKRIRHSLIRRDAKGVIHLVDAKTIALTRDGCSRQLGNALRGNVDAILGRALAKDPNRRYESVKAFVVDVLRHLDGEAVSVRGNLGRAMGRIAKSRVVRGFGQAAMMLALGFLSAQVIEVDLSQNLRHQDTPRHEAPPQNDVAAGVAPINSL